MPDSSVNPFLAEEKKTWEFLRRKFISSSLPLHPALRYSNWEAFVAAGKPWHNHGDRSFVDMPWGDDALKWEARQRNRMDVGMWLRVRESQGFVVETPERRGVQPMQPPRAAADVIPAGVRLQMLADANGGLGAIGITPGSPENQIRAYLDSVDRNGFKAPGNIRIA